MPVGEHQPLLARHSESTKSSIPNFRPANFNLEFRSSKWFILLAVNLAVFTDAFLYGLIVPVLPFALSSRVNLSEEDIQKWIGILVGAYGAGVLAGSRE